MKTYADLTKRQLMELFAILLSMPCVGQECDYERVVVRQPIEKEGQGPIVYVGLTDGAVIMRFGVQGGNVWLAGGGRLYNFFQFVDKCREFGLTYK